MRYDHAALPPSSSGEHTLTLHYWTHDDGIYLKCSCKKLGDPILGLNLGWDPTVEQVALVARDHESKLA